MNNNDGQRRGSKRQLTPREAAILTERKRAENTRKRRAAKKAFERFTAITVFALIGAAIALGIIFGFIFFDFRSKEKTPDEAVTITANDEKRVVLEDKFYFHRNGEYYVSLTKVASMCGLTLHGNVERMTLSFPDGMSVRFNVGSNVIEIAGMNCLMSNKTLFEFEQLFVPASFFTGYCEGVVVEHKENGKDKGFNITFDKNFSLLAKTHTNDVPDTQKPEKPVREENVVVPMFKADLSAYEEYMNPENKDEYLVLINTSNPLSADYVPTDLINIVDTRKDGRSTQKMRLYAAKALEAMFIEMRANGFTDVSVTSGYRSYAYQTTLLEREVSLLTPTYGDKAREQAVKQVAIPGTSEHQSGLCIDMHNLPSASEAFSAEAAYKWIYSNCANFGFILRFPKDKTHLTGIIFEPWHYRYVGRYHAQKIMEEGLCLEEYMQSIQ